MREIKYRSWDKDNQVMVYSDDREYCFVVHYDNKIHVFKVDSEIMHELNTEPAEEYTGLKDKNGKEIYEGDIIRHDWGLNKITYEDYSFTAEHITSFDGVFNCNLYLSDIGSDCEVIGNIFEDGDLLNGVQQNT